jgi:hypothetical protein
MKASEAANSRPHCRASGRLRRLKAAGVGIREELMDLCRNIN